MTAILIVLAMVGTGLMTERWFPHLLLAHMRRGIRKHHGLREYRTEAGGLDWSVLRGGKGDTVLFIPGFGSHKYQWGNAIYRLTRNAELVFVDMPGAGATRAAAAIDLSPDAQAGYVVALLRSLGVARVTLVGASVGGLVAGLVASRCPELVERLVLMDPAGIRGKYVTPLLCQFIDTGEQPFCYRTVDEFDALYAALFKTPPQVPGFLKRYLIRINTTLIPLRRRGLEALRSVVLDGLMEHLALLPRQTMVLWGQHDLLFDVCATRNIEVRAPWARLILLDSGHLPYLEQPGPVAENIRAFLATPATTHATRDIALVNQRY